MVKADNRHDNASSLLNNNEGTLLPSERASFLRYHFLLLSVRNAAKTSP